MRETVRLSLLLALIAALCGVLLVALAAKTEPARAATAERRRLAAVNDVLAALGERPRIEQSPAADGAFAAFSAAGDFAGAAIPGSSPHGYGGEVRLMVGFDADGRVLGFALLDAHETPGLGAKIARDDFRAQFAGLPFDADWRVRKDGGDIDAVTSATISSRAACEAVAAAASHFAAVRAAATP